MPLTLYSDAGEDVEKPFLCRGGYLHVQDRYGGDGRVKRSGKVMRLRVVGSGREPTVCTGVEMFKKLREGVSATTWDTVKDGAKDIERGH